MEQSQSPEFPDRPLDQEYGLHRCATHPDVETGLACGRCGKYICPRCLIQTPVGSRCNDCAKVTTHPTFDVKPTYYMRAAAAGGGVGIVAGILWGVLLSLGLFFAVLSGMAVGYAIGEAISRASNRKRSQGLAAVAVSSVVLAVLASFTVGSLYLVTSLFGLLSVGVAAYMAVNRVR